MSDSLWRRSMFPALSAAACFSLLVVSRLSAEEPPNSGKPVQYSAKDSLKPLADPNADAEKCLRNFEWKRGDFSVHLEPPRDSDLCDHYVRFPTAVPTRDETNDLVAMEWYQPKDKSGSVLAAPAVVVVHESGSAMPAGRSIAQGLRDRGLHTFLIHLPYYGLRRTPGKKPDATKILETMRQGVADARRARDAVAAIPGFDRRHIALQGTSLGGFVAALSGSLDRGYDAVFVMLAGGELETMFQNGRREVEKLRQQLADAGYKDEKLRQLLDVVEPTRIAHRLDPKTTWTYSAVHDEVVPIRNARRLAKSAGLAEDHQIEMPAGHITAALYLPVVMDRIVVDVKKLAEKPAAGDQQPPRQTAP